MAKIHRLNNKAGRCGNALAISCTCGATPLDTICNITTNSDLDVTFSGITNCACHFTNRCEQCYPEATQGCSQNLIGTFQLTWNGTLWRYFDQVIDGCVGPPNNWRTIEVARGCPDNTISVTAYVLDDSSGIFCDCFFGTGSGSPTPATINSSFVIGGCCTQLGSRIQAGHGGSALVAIH